MRLSLKQWREICKKGEIPEPWDVSDFLYFLSADLKEVNENYILLKRDAIDFT